MKMRNKKAAQIEAKKRHIADLKVAKARRRGEPILERPEPAKIEKPTILIVCEGKNTEPSYFRQFKLSSATIKALGDGHNTISLVNQAIILNSAKHYDQVWCVFDKDKFSANDFNNAINMTEANGFGVAYSNQAFEYWLILHFENHQGGAISRDDYDATINEHLNPLGVTYDGQNSKLINEDFFEILNGLDTFTNRPRIQLAIQRGKRNYDLWNHHSPAVEESSTTVFKLVEEILKFI